MAEERFAELRFYEELNDFLPAANRKRSFRLAFSGTPSVKDVIESLGVPPTGVDLVLVNGESVSFEHRLEGGERVAVYPVFERFDVRGLAKLRSSPLREPRFIADVHLGRLARYLRLVGLDTVYENDLEDAAIAVRAAGERRIVLTRDRGLLARRLVTRGHFVRANRALEQLEEVVRAFDLSGFLAPFTRCMKCNGLLQPVAKENVLSRLPPHTRESYEDFLECQSCEAVYWPGAHHDRLRAVVEHIAAL